MAQRAETTETHMANRALSHLGKPKITDIDSDTSNAGDEIRLHFASVRDGLQRQYPWNFCDERKRLTETGDGFGTFAHCYDLPEDCLWARGIDGDRNAYFKIVSGRRIATDLPPPLTLIYNRRVVEVAYWDELFRNAFCLHLAVACCPRLVTDETLAETLRQRAQEALSVALPSDAAEGAADEIPDTDFVMSRY